MDLELVDYVRPERTNKIQKNSADLGVLTACMGRTAFATKRLSFDDRLREFANILGSDSDPIGALLTLVGKRMRAIRHQESELDLPIKCRYQIIGFLLASYPLAPIPSLFEYGFTHPYHRLF